jgi:hypothetical protein
MDAFWSITFGIVAPQLQGTIELEAYDLCVEIADTLLRLDCRKPPRPLKEIGEQMTTAMLHRAVWLIERSKAHDGGIPENISRAKNDLMLIAKRYGVPKRGDRSLNFPAQAAWALLNRGVLSFPERPNSALRYFGEVERTYAPPQDTASPEYSRRLEPWVKAVCNSAVVYLSQRNLEMALQQALKVQKVKRMQSESNQIASVREKAKRIEERCGQQMAMKEHPSEATASVLVSSL